MEQIHVQDKKVATEEHVRAAMAEESLQKQKTTRDLDITLGDRNTSYFHNSVKARRTTNKIT